jgi:enamine deaminase RidA (YjgF/YER057c/UK114 family)
VEWKSQVKGGVVVTSGNSQTKGGTANANVSRKAGNNRFTLDGGFAYGQSSIVTPVFDNVAAPTAVVGLSRTTITSTNNWVTRGRYDRFFTLNNSAYVSGQAAADKVAGKTFYGGGQIGYSRQLVKNEVHALLAEIGYDLSYESYVQQPGKTIDPVTIHSARLFVGEVAKLTDTMGASLSFEALFNLNSEPKALNVSTKMPGVDAFRDTRLVGKLGFTTTLVKRLSIGFGFSMKYDQNPAALPLPTGTPPNVPYAPGVVPFAEKLDTQLEMNLIYTFL